MLMKGKKLWLVSALFLGTSAVYAGGNVRMYAHGEVPQASEVADILTGGRQTVWQQRTRGISLDHSALGDKRVEKHLAAVAEPTDTAIGLPVEFAFNSAEIAPAYRKQLDAVAEGIKMAKGVSVVVEGHTDAHGPEAYNEHLSIQRAEAVRGYLIKEHGIGANMLVIRGYGENQPIHEDNPFASNNRRVQFRAVN